MVIRPSAVRKVITLGLISIFVATNLTYSQDITSSIPDTVAIPSICQEHSPTPESADFRQLVMDDYNFMAVAFSIADHLLDEDGSLKSLPEDLQKDFSGNRDYLEIHSIELSRVRVRDNVVEIRFQIDGKKGIMGICPSAAGYDHARKEDRWNIVGKYAVFIEKDHTEEPDLKGSRAGATNPLIQDKIREGKVVEVYIDGNTGRIRANRVNWIGGVIEGKPVSYYVPYVTSPEVYRGEEIGIDQLFSETEKRNLEKWMKKHKVRGAPIKFRIALDAAALGWKDDAEHSNIAHTGMRDGVIYTGSVLLKAMFRPGNEDLMREVLEKDELNHLRGLGHGDRAAVSNRLSMVEESIDPFYFESLKTAMYERNPYFLLDQLRQWMDNPQDLADFLSTINSIALSQPLYPVEGTYPIKHAVSLLSGEEQNKLAEILMSKEMAASRDMAVVNDILIMLSAEEPREEWERTFKKQLQDNWVNNYIPELKGRTLYQVSPEIWHESGGLARVMQYHGAGIHELLKGSNVGLAHVEPHYQYRINPEQQPESLDYQKDITHPMEDISPVDSFKVTVGGKEVDVEVSMGVNDLGIEIFLIRDVQDDGSSFYTHSLYNYRNDPYEKDPLLPTWEEFSTFYSKSALEFVTRREAQKRKDMGQAWKAPVVHVNDSQTALVPVYRKMSLKDAQKKYNSSGSKDDERILEVIKGMTISFTTHTYKNRKEYSLETAESREYADEVMELMDIPDTLRELFRNYKKDGKHYYDMASGGLRTADSQSAVARAHRDDIALWDEWVNDPNNPVATWLKAELEDPFLSVNITAIANGDHRESTAAFFRSILKRAAKRLGEEADVEHPSAEQVREAKKIAKAELRLKGGKKVYSSRFGLKQKRGKDPISIELDPERPVVSYSGRLVPEKAGMDRALREDNIEKMVKRGVQVVIYGNVQNNYDDSTALQNRLIALAERLKGEDLPGSLTFVPRFSLEDQRTLLAASDVGVHDSDPGTEAAGYTEADDSVCAGIVVAPLREGEYYNQGIGEGLFKAQGAPIDYSVTGKGNTIIPQRMDAESYFDAIMKFLALGPEQMSRYQAGSIAFSRALDARLTAAAYLRHFNKAVESKRAKERNKEIFTERKEMEERSRSLLRQISRRSSASDTSYQVTQKVIEGKANDAVVYLLTSEVFQRINDNLDVPASIFNNLLSIYGRDRSVADNLVAFANDLKEKTVVLSGNDKETVEAVKALQVMAQQALMIKSWIDRGIEGADEIRLTSRPNTMAQNQKRGKSYLDVYTLPESVVMHPSFGTTLESKEEGKPGYYWRGTEGVSKLGKDVKTTLQDGTEVELPRNVVPELVYDHEAFSSSREKLVMYIMNHGYVAVPARLKQYTEDGKVSTNHGTGFTRRDIPGIAQAVSTGPGHFQGRKMDLKKIVSGTGFQFNVRYDMDGNIEEVIAQYVVPGSWAVSLPGHVDYMVAMDGELLFDDISLELDVKEAKMFNKEFDFSDESEKAISAAIKTKGFAPYAGAIFPGGSKAVVKVMDDDKINARWANEFSEGMSETMALAEIEDILDYYRSKGPGSEIRLANIVARNLKASFVDDPGEKPRLPGREDVPIPLSKEAAAARVEKEIERLGKPDVTLGKTGAMDAYIEDNADFVVKTLLAEKAQDKLIRVSIETVERIGADTMKGLLKKIQETPHGFVEIYSEEGPDALADTSGLVTKELPDTLKGSNRSRSNTITLFSVEKGEELPASKANRRWKDSLGGQDIEDTIIAPVGKRYDRLGVIRSIFFGLRLAEINRTNVGPESNLVKTTFADYLALYVGQGRDSSNFDLTAEDIVNIASGADIVTVIRSLNKLIKLLPIMPVNVEEQKLMYERAREILIRA